MKVRIALTACVVAAGMTGCQMNANRPAPDPAKVAAEPAPAKPTVPDGPVPGSPTAKAQSQALVRQAAESLNEGNEEKGRSDIAEALRLDPESKLGLCLNRGVSADPEHTLGRAYTKYTVRPSETLGRIAQRAFGESCEFYLLARYNGIRIPKQLAGGQVIRIPGRVPLAPPEPGGKVAPDPLVVPAEAAAAVTPAAGSGDSAASAAKAALSPQELRAQIDRHHRDAQAAFRRQDLTTAIREWDQVLVLDPTNDLARARRQEAVELDRRIKQVK